MPPPPVFADGAGEIGVVEVFRQRDTEKFTDTDGHIAVPGKIEIELHHVGRVAQNQNRRGQCGRRDRRYLGVDECQLVRDDGFLGKAQNQPLDAVAEAVKVNFAGLAAGVQLRGLLVIPHDRPRRPMAEESQEHRELKRAFFRLGAAHGNINAVADGSKHVKADAQRQRRGEHRQQPRHNSIDAFGRKACILKAAQHGHVQQHQHRQQWFFVGQPPQPQPA